MAWSFTIGTKSTDVAHDRGAESVFPAAEYPDCFYYKIKEYKRGLYRGDLL